MEIKEYLEVKIEIQNYLLNYIDGDNDDSQVCFGQFVQNFDIQETPEDRSELKSALCLVSMVSRNHKRTPTFFDKLEKIITELRPQIEQTFSNSELFNIFQKSKRLLLYLIETGIITLNTTIIDSLKSLKFQTAHYIEYFEPEINKFDGYSTDSNDEEFNAKRKRGENDQFLCTLIQNDSIEEFISHHNKGEFSLTDEISPSIFETNQFLQNKNVTLIEYSAFHGAIQIFQYLVNNNVELTSSLWLFSIHGKNSEIIHFLEENNILPAHYSYEECVVEAIECHHNDIYKYITENYAKKEISFDDLCYFASKSIKYNNYETFPDNLNNSSIFYDLCQYDYYPLVKFFINEVNVKINEVIVSSKNFFIKFHDKKF